MLKLFCGFLIIVVGIIIAVLSFYYAWASSTPGFMQDVYYLYQLCSAILGAVAVVAICFGSYMVVISIKKINSEYRKAISNTYRKP